MNGLDENCHTKLKFIKEANTNAKGRVPGLGEMKILEKLYWNRFLLKVGCHRIERIAGDVNRFFDVNICTHQYIINW